MIPASCTLQQRGITGGTVLESGEPFSVIDFLGTAASLYYSADDFVTNPILKSNLPYVNLGLFSVPFLKPGQDGVPAMRTSRLSKPRARWSILLTRLPPLKQLSSS